MIRVFLAVKWKDYLFDGGVGFVIYSGNTILYEHSQKIYDVSSYRTLFYKAMIQVLTVCKEMNLNEIELVSSNCDEVNRFNSEIDADDPDFQEIKKIDLKYKLRTVFLGENVYAIYLSLKSFKEVKEDTDV